MSTMSITGTVEIRYVLLDRFLLALAEGWQFSSWIVQPMHGHHGAYSVLMERAA